MSQNPLLEQGQLPDFESIKPEHVKPAVEQCINDARQTIDDVLARRFQLERAVEPLTDADEKLEHVWAPVSHLNSVVSTPELREAHDSCLPLLSDYATYVGQHKGLFDAYETLRNGDEFAELTEAQQKLELTIPCVIFVCRVSIYLRTKRNATLKFRLAYLICRRRLATICWMRLTPGRV